MQRSDYSTMVKTWLCSMLIVSSVVGLPACSSETLLLESFKVKKGDTVSLSVDHWSLPFTETNLYFNFDPPIAGHSKRDYSDVIDITVLDVDGVLAKVVRIYDINGSGETLRVMFEDRRPQIKHIEIKFHMACSGSLKLKSWRPL
jgi:hypothetical protein